MHSSFAMIIPTRERHCLLRRTIQYLEKINFKYDIIIGDSSQTDFIESANLKITYVNFPKNIDIGQKIKLCLDMVKTQYVSILGDDDFINHEVIPKICQFLDENPDYVAVDGQELRVICDENESWQNIFHQQRTIENDNLNERIETHCRFYWPTFYNIHRTNVLQKSFLIYETVQDYGYLWQELSCSISTIMQGKYKNIPEPYLIRQVHHQASTSTVWWNQLLKQKIFTIQYNNVIKILTNFYESNGGVGSQKFSNLLKKSINSYLLSFKKQNRNIFFRKICHIIFPTSLLRCMIALKKSFVSNTASTNSISNNNLHLDFISSDFYKNAQWYLTQYPLGIKK